MAASVAHSLWLEKRLFRLWHRLGRLERRRSDHVVADLADPACHIRLARPVRPRREAEMRANGLQLGKPGLVVHRRAQGRRHQRPQARECHQPALDRTAGTAAPLTLPAVVTTVRDAATHLLESTGYHLALECGGCPPEAPEIGRKPISSLGLRPELTTVKRALVLVAGSRTRLVVDDQARVVSCGYLDQGGAPPAAGPVEPRPGAAGDGSRARRAGAAPPRRRGQAGIRGACRGATKPHRPQGWPAALTLLQDV